MVPQLPKKSKLYQMAVLVLKQLKPVPNVEVKKNCAQLPQGPEQTALSLDVLYNKTDDPFD